MPLNILCDETDDYINIIPSHIVLIQIKKNPFSTSLSNYLVDYQPPRFSRTETQNIPKRFALIHLRIFGSAAK